MIDAMSRMGLDYLYSQIGEESQIPLDLMEWYLHTRDKESGRIIRFLSETIPLGRRLLIVSVNRDDTSKLDITPAEITENNQYKLPFVKPVGARSPQIGPVLKLGWNQKGDYSPTRPVIKSTLETWQSVSEASESYSSYFQEILEKLNLDFVQNPEGDYLRWRDEYDSSLECVVKEYGPAFTNSVIAIADKNGNLPGENTQYLDYLTHNLIQAKYETNIFKGIRQQRCHVCGAEKEKVYVNGLKGAGINIANVDREGAFNEISASNAWKNFAICSDCADLLYIYKYKFLQAEGDDKIPYQLRIAGDLALIIPTLDDSSSEDRIRLIQKMNIYVKEAFGDVITAERRLWNIITETKSILNITIAWLKIAQVIDDLNGMIVDIPPTRLKEISEKNQDIENWNSALFPENQHTERFKYTLSQNWIHDLLQRPGGQKAKTANTSPELKEVKRDIARAIFYKEKINDQRFMKTAIKTAEYYLLAELDNENHYGLTHEASGKAKDKVITFAGWIKWLAFSRYYLKQMEVLEMENGKYEAQSELLKPYFDEASGINTEGKAFAFILGVLFGRLLVIQGARGVNVASNAMTWLKRLSLKGKDLPELYVKIREKLLSYGAESSGDTREILAELGQLGSKLGTGIQLDPIATNYFLLLGQSVSSKIIKSKVKTTTEE